jgi:hypothetical protein
MRASALNHRDTEAQRREQRELIRHAFDAILEDGDAEVNQESDSNPGESQIGEQLGFVNGEQFFDSLQFDHEPPREEQVHAQVNVDVQTFVNDGKGFLRIMVDASQPKFVFKA